MKHSIEVWAAVVPRAVRREPASHADKVFGDMQADLLEVHAAAAALIADVRLRYPGEDLKCPLMRQLDAALHSDRNP